MYFYFNSTFNFKYLTNIRKWHKFGKNCSKILVFTKFNQLLSLSHLPRMSSFNLHTSSRIHAPFVNCRESSSSFSRKRCHTEPAPLCGFWSRQHQSSCHQIKQPQPQPCDTWQRIHVASLNSASISCVFTMSMNWKGVSRTYETEYY